METEWTVAESVRMGGSEECDSNDPRSKPNKPRDAAMTRFSEG